MEGSTLPVDVSLSAEELVVEAQLPGIKPDEVDLTVENGRLTIRAETASERSVEDGDYLLREIRRGALSRSITLPTGLKPEKATATFEDGILTLRIPKAEETKPRQIRINPTANRNGNDQRPLASTTQGG